MDLNELLKTLTSADAPAGYEAAGAALAAELLRPYADEVTVDALGNVIAVRRCGKDGAVRVMLDAHIDEIGLVITGNDGGFLRFAALGGVDARILPAATVKILTSPPIFGVIDVLPPHLLKGEEAEKTVKIEDLFIDVGLDAESAEKLVPPGTPAVSAAEPMALGDRLFTSKALDDRACFAAILRALELLGDAQLGFDLIVLASAQEELGTRGAAPAAFASAPDYCIITDVDFAKAPDSKPFEGKPLGSGAIISRGPNMNRAFTDKIIEIAKAGDIPHTISVEPGDSGTDARVIQTARAGVATALLGIPLRYMHSAVETVDPSDVEALARLICGTLKGCDFDA